MDNADALVHYPLEEAFGLVVAEALSRGLKVFASAVGGITDICHSVSSTVLVPPDDFKRLSISIYDWLSVGRPRAPEAALIIRNRYCSSCIAEQTVGAYYHALYSN